MPNAFLNAGYVVGSIGTIFIGKIIVTNYCHINVIYRFEGFVCTYAIHVLISAEYEVCKRNKVSVFLENFLKNLSKSKEILIF